MKRFLVTTALEETWRQNEPVLFLGEWCRLYSRKNRWSKMDAEVLSYHWGDREKLYADYQYLQEFYERLLRDLSIQLNQIHRVDHGLRYWRILVGPWLSIFMARLLDSWISIHLAQTQYDLSGTVVLVGQEEALIPNDMDEFLSFFVGDEWNHQLYSSILQGFTSVPCVKQVRLKRDMALEMVPAISWKRKFNRAIVGCYSRVASLLTRDRDAFLLNTYLSCFNEMRLCRRLREVPQFWPLVSMARTTVNKNQRQWVVPGESRSDFEVCARALVPQQIPGAYLEGYEQLIEQAMDLPWPTKPKFIWTSNSHISNDIFKAWAAEKAEHGFPLVIGQHGGHYGVGLWSFNEDHELAISDYYLSWGWTKEDQPKIKPVGQLKENQLLKVPNSKKERLALVTCTVPRYSYPTRSFAVAGQYLEYLNDQYVFVENLPNHIREKLTVRLGPHDNSWEQATRWRDHFPGLHLDDGQFAINDLISRCRICIVTYNATAFLELFSKNVPTVMYWNPNYWELRDSAIPYFDDLKRVGIFHETPESAARHATEVWGDVDLWWESPTVQNVLNSFKEQYCRADNMLERLGASLKEIAAENENRSTETLKAKNTSSDML